ncbi:MAG: S8 family serine peptidase [Candidatus Acidoferrales bacterium]
MRKRCFFLGIVLSVALLAGVVGTQGVLAGPSSDSEAAGNHNLLGVIIHTAKPYNSVIAKIEKLGGTVTIQYKNVDAIAAKVPADKFALLASLRGVERVEKDYIVELSPPNERSLEARALNMDDYQLHNAESLAAEFGELPDNYYSYLSQVTGAADTWAATGAGASSLTAVIDTGTDASHVCLAGRVIAGPDFSPDVGTPFEGSTLVTNNFHGTFVGGVIATGNGCFILDGVGGLFDTHLPANAKFPFSPGLVLIPLNGMAPASSIYAVKVFPHTGAGIPSSIIEQALDHVISVKKSGTLDIDVVNMSLGGAAVNDGRTLEEMLVDAATEAGMAVVISSGNEGPAPNSVANPGTAFSALTVAAATDPVHTRIFWDLVFGPGAGAALFPTAEIRVADFSSQGPSADGRNAVDIIATGVFNFSLFPGNGLGWASGTSFSAPTVAGGAALLNSWAEANDPSIGPRAIRNALMDGANSLGPDWSQHAQGHGFLNVPDALALLQGGHVNSGLRHDHSGNLKPTVLLGGESEVTQTVTLGRARTHDWVFEIDEETESVEIIVDVDGPIPPGPGGAFGFANSFELYVKSAKHGGTSYLLDTANVFDDASVLIGDGTVDLFGAIAGGVVSAAPMEPGLMKVTLEADWTNNVAELTGTVTIRRVQGSRGNNAGGATNTVTQDDFQCFPVIVPAGTTATTYELSWKHGWDKFPTNDLDLLFASPSSLPSLDFSFLDAATLNAPERQIITSPEPGLWFVCVNGFTVNRGRDPYVLELTLE